HLAIKQKRDKPHRPVPSSLNARSAHLLILALEPSTLVVEKPLVRDLAILPVPHRHLIELRALAALEGNVHLPLGEAHIAIHSPRFQESAINRLNAHYTL